MGDFLKMQNSKYNNLMILAMCRIVSIFINSSRITVAAVVFIFSFSFMYAQDTSEIKVSVKIRGVYDSKITLTPFDGRKAINPVGVVGDVLNGETGVITVPQKYLPGEFVLRLDYRSKESDYPYPSEKYIYIYKQDIFLNINPPYINNTDSTVFEKTETENNAYLKFTAENAAKRKQLDLLKQFLMGYDDTKSKFFIRGTKEFEKRRKIYNAWLKDEAKKYSFLYISKTFMFQHIPSVSWNGTEKERTAGLLDKYFEGIDFSDTLITRLRELSTFMSAYVGLYGAQATTVEMRDSLFTRAGSVACESASKGHPKVYGWMVDYFFAGYETYNIQMGIKMLQKHIDNPSCLTLKKQQIVKRLDGMKKLVAGSVVPDFSIPINDSTNFNLYSYKTSAPFKMILFWSAACEHCQQLVASLKEWYAVPANKAKLDIIAVSLDDSEADVATWKNKITELHGWTHLITDGGVNSKIANDYFLLSTPVMFVLDSKTNIIKAAPADFEALKKFFE